MAGRARQECSLASRRCGENGGGKPRRGPAPCLGWRRGRRYLAGGGAARGRRKYPPRLGDADGTRPAGRPIRAGLADAGPRGGHQGPPFASCKPAASQPACWPRKDLAASRARPGLQRARRRHRPRTMDAPPHDAMSHATLTTISLLESRLMRLEHLLYGTSAPHHRPCPPSRRDSAVHRLHQLDQRFSALSSRVRVYGELLKICALACAAPPPGPCAAPPPLTRVQTGPAPTCSTRPMRQRLRRSCRRMPCSPLSSRLPRRTPRRSRP